MRRRSFWVAAGGLAAVAISLVVAESAPAAGLRDRGDVLGPLDVTRTSLRQTHRKLEWKVHTLERWTPKTLDRLPNIRDPARRSPAGHLGSGWLTYSNVDS